MSEIFIGAILGAFAQFVIERGAAYLMGIKRNGKSFRDRLDRDEEGADKLEDGYPLNTYVEITLAWIAIMLTSLVVIAVIWVLFLR